VATGLPPEKPRSLFSRLFSRPGESVWRVGSGADAERFAGPIRGELLGAEGLAEQARALARRQRVMPPTQARGSRSVSLARGQRPLLERLEQTRRILESARTSLAAAAERGGDVSASGEWLLDNFYVVQEHLREIRASMPRGYYQELPKLAAGTLAGYPRVYEVAIALIGHSEGHVDMDNVQLFVREFQRGATLTTGELWAVPTMLRLGLMENIRRMALRTVQRVEEVEAADRWAQRLRDASDEGPAPLASALAGFVSGHPPLSPTFVARFLQQLRTYQTNFTPLVWLEQWIAEDSLSAEDAIARSNQRQALTQVMMANSITSLRTIARLDWSEFVEASSAVEAILRKDPTGDYARTTFGTRDLYRHVVEDIAKGTGLEERDVAQRALDLAQRAAATPAASPGSDGRPDPRTSHIGYYLLSDGRAQLEAAARFRPPWTLALHRWTLAHADTVYFGGITVVTLLLLAVAFMILGPLSLGDQWIVLVFALIPANDIAINIIHQLITLFLPPRILAKLDLEESGIPVSARTAVVVPTLLGSVEAVREALEHLEVQFLANRDPRLHFALLSDFTDAPAPAREGDGAILDAAVRGVHALNERYPSVADEGATFLLFHRPRLWNATQGAWMGWERKRGKLAQFNRYLRGGARDAFSVVAGDTRTLGDVRYVITLDSDTVLPRSAASTLVGTMAHPLNRAEYDPASGRVVRGYGILQPRIGITLTSASRSRFAAMYSGHPGVDPYTTAVSDVYQDLYGEGSYTGKGIYDVDAFELATHGRFPENTLLSHDLIEGAYSRAALATDIELYDDYPTRYLTFTRRKHRWIRGDWQLLRWLGARVPGPDGPERNRLSAISRWKIFDNLRRSVVEIAQLTLLLAGWLALPGTPAIWTALVLAGMASQWAFSIAIGLVRLPGDKSWRAYYRSIGRDAVTSAEQFTLSVVFLPHQAAVSADAIVRTLWRLFVTRRNLLEWQTASQVERVMGTGSPREVWRRMWPAVAIAAAAGVSVLGHLAWEQWHGAGGHASWTASHPGFYLLVTLPFVMLWLASPSIAISLSEPAIRRQRQITATERWTALRYALLHWRYFDRFVTAETQWLAPDNFQEDPVPVVANRTSPTNIGLQLLGTVSAYDLGFLCCGAMIERLELVFRSLEGMERFRGHFYNWYELSKLRTLDPPYISTVDSGNLAGHLLALKQACLSIADDPLDDGRIWEALYTALTMAAEELRGLASSGAVDSPRQWQAVLEAAERVRAVLASLPQVAGWPSASPPFTGGSWPAAARGRTSRGTIPTPPTGRAALGRGAAAPPAMQTLVDRLRAAERVLTERGGGAPPVSASQSPAPASAAGSAAAGSLAAASPAAASPAAASPAVIPVDASDGWPAGGPSTEPATIWLTWGRALLERHLTELASIGAPNPGSAGPGGTDKPTSLREAAASSVYAAEQVARLDALALRAATYASEMDFKFLFDTRRMLFAIGYQVGASALDPSYYDLLASEARLASFIAIAKNDVPVEHWFKLGRSLTMTAGNTALISWAGSMFEYLMPVLVMKSFPFTLLDQTYSGAVSRQIAYGRERSVPWGVSESAYNARDRQQVYQYRAFGVPDLALKRGLSRDLVVAPYATLLALPVEPHQAMRNLAALESEGALGPFGFRDAVDYTRPALGSRRALVGAYMAHHIGMGLVALTNAVTRDLWPRRFHTDALVRSAELVLFEQIPRRFVLQDAQTGELEERPRRGGAALEKPAARSLDTADTPQPRLALLGHPPYTVMITNGGGGYSQYDRLDVTRWRADATLDDTGQWCYLKDVTPPAVADTPPAGRPRVWSASHQPVCATADWYRVTFSTDRATFHRRDGDLETRLEVTVVPDDSAEVRRVTVTNRGPTAREVEVTSYGEIVLSPHDADRQHPAFANLFVQTEWLPGSAAVLASRRPRSAQERTVWGVHVAAVGGGGGADAWQLIGPVTCETDRARFLGRARGVRHPAMLDDAADGPLPGTTGAVLDPVFALRARVRIEPSQSAKVAFTTLVAPDRERAVELADRYHDPYSAQRALDLSWMQSQVEMRELGITPADAALYQEIAGYLLSPTPAVRAPQKDMLQARRGQDALWAHGISGDNPILLAFVDSPAGLPTVRELLAAHHYWRLKGLVIDLVLLNTYPPTYLQELQDALQTTVMASTEGMVLDKPGGVFIRRQDITPPDDLTTLRAVARVELRCDSDLRLSEILEVPDAPPPYPAPFVPRTSTASAIVTPSTLAAAAARSAADGLSARMASGVSRGPIAPPPANGLGALAADGAYEIVLREGVTTPAPWSNVIANERAGFVVSEGGGGYSWVDNSFFYRLTPWRNDPVTDQATEIVYLRDDETGEVWTPAPQPIRHSTPYTVRHAAGSTEFQHTHSGIATSLMLGMAGDDPVKIGLLTMTNETNHPRRLTITAYAEWVLGVARELTRDNVVTSFDRDADAVFARNGFDPQYAATVAFMSVSEPITGYTADRSEFLGRNGDYADPAALRRALLAEATGVGLDPCAAVQFEIMLGPGETRTVATLLGGAEDQAEARRLVRAYKNAGAARRALDASRAAWRQRLSTVTVRTPEPEFDAMLNGWLLYQALACRMWGRTALYQSSGAYGFRDQLQDSAAFVYAAPAVTRAHLVRSAGRQFKEGDVQHWWHPQSGRGVRTRFSDDLAWLPYIVDRYITVTGDTGVLDERAPYLTSRLLDEGEQELYDRPDVSQEEGTVYDHCVRALRRATTTGSHGLPLIGCGDWNDGFNRVGVDGRGESVWLAWFLITGLRAFAARCDARGDGSTAAEFRSKADAYAQATEQHAWDGEWYRRAYFDDGTPLGSATSDECKIDSIAQSWGVISGAAPAGHAAQAMASLNRYLVRSDARLIALLTPPFDHTAHDPGYIKGYLPGVRENGAQYTHAALWAVWATALHGDGDRATELYQMINPLTHTRTPEDVARYKVEPFVVVADVYTATGHVGRGGWTWYTGSASWMYRVGLEAILGFTKTGTTLRIDPCIPRAWEEAEIVYRFGLATYRIRIRNPAHVSRGVGSVTVDGAAVKDGIIPLADDGLQHDVLVELRGTADDETAGNETADRETVESETVRTAEQKTR
jgi:cyclic beta-1,2-glucan synthetase